MRYTCIGRPLKCTESFACLWSDAIDAAAGIDYNGCVEPRAERRNWTELNWHGLVFDELTNGQAGRAC